MDEIYQLLYKSMVLLKEMEKLANISVYGVDEYIKKQDELNSTLIEIIRLLIFKKD